MELKISPAVRVICMMSALLWCVEGTIHHSRCKPGMWRNRRLNLCITCSECPMNQIIRTPCTSHKDTVCGPFYEWMNGANSGNKYSNHTAIVDIRFEEPQKIKHENSENIIKDNNQKTDKVDLSETPYFAPETTDGERHWKIVSFSLIGVIAIIVISALIFGVLKMTRKQLKGDDTEPVYVRTRIFSRDRLPTTEYMKHLAEMDMELGPQHGTRKKHLQRVFRPKYGIDYRDEVFDGSEESIYKSVNGGKFRLQAIPEDLLEKEIEKRLHSQNCTDPLLCSSDAIVDIDCQSCTDSIPSTSQNNSSSPAQV